MAAHFYLPCMLPPSVPFILLLSFPFCALHPTPILPPSGGVQDRLQPGPLPQGGRQLHRRRRVGHQGWRQGAAEVTGRDPRAVTEAGIERLHGGHPPAAQEAGERLCGDSDRMMSPLPICQDSTYPPLAFPPGPDLRLHPLRRCLRPVDPGQGGVCLRVGLEEAAPLLPSGRGRQGGSGHGGGAV